MRQILRDLNRKAPIDGSMVITPDGILVAAALEKDLEEDAVAAFASSLLLALNRQVAALTGGGKLASCTLAGTVGKITFFDMENSYLVIVATPDLDLEIHREAIARTIHEIKHRRVA